jgi:hypothetical protein
MTSVAQKAGAFADRVIAAGEASSKNLGVVGLPVAAVTGVVTVPGGAIIGGVGKGVAKAVQGAGDAYRISAAPKWYEMNQNKTVQAAGFLGVSTAVVAGAAALAGIGDFTLLGALALGVGGAGVGFVGSGLANGAVQGAKGLVDGVLKGGEAGLGAAKFVGGKAQVGAEKVADCVVKVVKNIPHVVETAAHNGGERLREGYEHLSVREADAAQAAADLLKEKANAVSNGHPRYGKNGEKLADVPADIRKY